MMLRRSLAMRPDAERAPGSRPGTSRSCALQSGERTSYNVPAVFRITRLYDVATILRVTGFSQATTHLLKVFIGQLDANVSFTRGALTEAKQTPCVNDSEELA
jgi:hypothetical protein